MSKPTDQELDSLFRAAADGLRPAYDPAAWEAMNKLLDQPKSPFWKSWMTYLLLGSIVFTIGIWVGISISTTSQSNSQLPQAASSLNQKFLKLDKEEDCTPAIKSTNDFDSKPNQSVEDASVGKSSKASAKISANQKFGSGNEVSSTIYSTKPPSTFVDFPNQVTNHQELVAHSATDIVNEEITTRKNIAILSDLKSDSIKKSGNIDEKIDSTMHSEKAEIIHDKQQFANAKFSVRAQVSPDFSSVDYNTPSRVGSNFGIMIDYALTPRWSLATGVIKSRKTYVYDGDIAYGTHMANQLDGTCGVLDLPLTAYYSLRSNGRTSWRAGLGLSSYLMLDEDYTYTVNYGTTSKSYNTQVSNKNNEWFKLLNLSVIYQYQINSQLGLIAEPFLKAPLDGVGEGSVLLSSMGIFLGASFKIK